ncbi:DUF790 family protein (plasmid) [Halococcus dombrowskii]|uniref:DUF790 family protein n=1 Tax=Halococcus dombrowskii TaxID=179637 RepID=A0AAV3SGU7_HALDO|nr:DUF790 family protein [Halococcus dombrowskii]UOO97512.1 DUF790 family protein [Halococcus dombrowskii]
MLTADLARSRTSDGEVTPLFIDPDDARYRKTAGELIELFETHVGEPKADLDTAIDQLTVADTDYKIIQGLAKLLRDECDFETVAAAEPHEIRQRLFERANDSYPIVRQPTLEADTRKLDVYTAVADELGISLAECHQGMYADLDANNRLVRFGDQVAESVELDTDGTTTTTQLTGQSEESYTGKALTDEWLLNRYNLALAQAVLYDATELRIRVWDQFATVFSYVKLFGLMHRIYPIDEHGERVSSTDLAEGYEAILDGPASLFRQSRKYGIRMANFLPALPHCKRWELTADILVDESANETRELTLDQTTGFQTHYSGGSRYDSDLERTLADKWSRSNTEWNLVREDDVIDLGAEVLLPDFAMEHPDGRRTILEIMGFWTPEYLEEKLAKIRQADVENLVLAVSENLDCTSEDIDIEAARVLWFKTGIHVYDVVDLAERYATQAPSAGS